MGTSIICAHFAAHLMDVPVCKKRMNHESHKFRVNKGINA